MPVTIIHAPHLDATQREQLLRSIPGRLEPRRHCHQLHHDAAAARETVAALREQLALDINSLPPGFEPQRVRLVISDMDSTFINIECIDEIADHAGLKPEVSAVTEAAMRGEINFQTSLTRRVALLEGLPVTALQQVYDERLRLNPGAEHMLAGLRGQGIRFALVSGGFTFFTERLRQRLQLDFTLANVLAVNGGHLAGRVEGEIVGPEAKQAYLAELCRELKIAPQQTVALGDGANDLLMLGFAGLGVAYHAKPKVQAAAAAAINHGGLDRVLDLLGIDA